MIISQNYALNLFLSKYIPMNINKIANLVV
jgi:hypothetical protein